MMMKKALALTLALLMLLMPMTASAVTWNAIVEAGYNHTFESDNVKVSTDAEGVVTVESMDADGDKGIVDMGDTMNPDTQESVDMGMIDRQGKYVFKNIEIPNLVASADGNSIEILLDDQVSVGFMEADAVNNGSLKMIHDGEVLFGVFGNLNMDGSNIEITGTGTITAYDDPNGSNVPLDFSVQANSASEEDMSEALDYLKSHVSVNVDQVVVTGNGKLGIYEIWNVDENEEWNWEEVEIVPE